jgi:hypothetical protein
MKISILKTFVLVFISGFILTSCTKDKTSKENSFSYNGKAYKTPNGFIVSYGINQGGGTSSFDIFLYSENITYSPTVKWLSGRGSGVYLDLVSPSMIELAAGTYNFDPAFYFGETTTAKKASTFIDAYVDIDYDFDTRKEYEAHYVDKNSSGVVKISKINNIYEIEYTIEVEAGKTVKGYFKGELEELIAESPSKKMAKERRRK